MRIFKKILLTGGVVVFAAAIVIPVPTGAISVEDLRNQLQQKRAALKKAEENIKTFQEQIQLKRKEARTLQEQIALIEDDVDELELNLSKTQAEIDETAVQIEEVREEIRQREADIEAQKTKLAEYLRSINQLDQESSVTVFLKYQSFSEAMNEIGTITELQNRGEQTLVAIKQLHEELQAKQRDLDDYRQTLESLKKRQESQKKELTVQKESKNRILELTNQKESQYQGLLKNAQAAHRAAEADISGLDALIREELKKQGVGELPHVDLFDWPIPVLFGISCEFQCSDYPYAYLIGPHAAIDIPAYVGTAVKAPADGYVARVHDAKGPGYSYIMLIHGDNLSTVFGHLSGFAVNEGQMVTRGTVIGYTGGAPGMNGAGLSTGPHLHFEVRLNNVPVNPRKYL